MSAAISTSHGCSLSGFTPNTSPLFNHILPYLLIILSLHKLTCAIYNHVFGSVYCIHLHLQTNRRTGSKALGYLHQWRRQQTVFFCKLEMIRWALATTLKSQCTASSHRNPLGTTNLSQSGLSRPRTMIQRFLSFRIRPLTTPALHGTAKLGPLMPWTV